MAEPEGVEAEIEGEQSEPEEREVLLSRAVETATAAPGEVRALSKRRGNEVR